MAWLSQPQGKKYFWIIFDLAADGARSAADFKPIFDKDSDHPDILDTLKQIAFYTDCFEKGD